MAEVRRERLIIGLVILTASGCIFETFTLGWELWMVPVLFAGIVGVLWTNLSQKLQTNFRYNIYFIYSALVVFYDCVHENAFLDPVIMVGVFISAFALFGNVTYVNIGLLEYFIVLANKLGYHIVDKNIQMDFVAVSNIINHAIAILGIYGLCRISIMYRNTSTAEIDRLQSEAGKSHSDIADFLTNISHELRTPVNVINGMTSLIQKDFDSDEVKSLKEAGIRLTHQIEDIQDYTEVTRKEVLINASEYMCDSLVNDVIAYYKSVAGGKKLELVIGLDPKTPSVLKGDIEKLHKIFRHLIDNAIKFTKKGGIYIRIYPMIHEHGINLIIEIKDTGIGMTRSEIDKLSKGRYQANRKRNRSTGGIGLGYPIVYGFVRKMNGFVQITSEKKKGTCVHISIPQEVVDSRPGLSVNVAKTGDVIFYQFPKKIKVPQVREFRQMMVSNLQMGLGINIYSAGDRKELEKLLAELNVTHIFTEYEEYTKDQELLEELAGRGVSVVVAADSDNSSNSGRKAMFMTRPLTGLTVVRVINEEYEKIFRLSDDNIKSTLIGKKALIVDDEPMNLVVATGIFKEYGLIIDTADSGKDAIEKYKAGDAEVIFMDHMMPEMDGVEAMHRIRQVATETHRNPAIIALTANVLSGAREMFMKEGFDGFLAKPIDIKEFERVMKRVLPKNTKVQEGRA